MLHQTDYALDAEGALQTWVVRHAAAVVVHDPIHDPLSNRTAVRETNLKNAIIAPLLLCKGTPFGTLLVERDDDRRNTEDDRIDLEQFAASLGGAIAQTEWVETTPGRPGQNGVPGRHPGRSLSPPLRQQAHRPLPRDSIRAALGRRGHGTGRLLLPSQ